MYLSNKLKQARIEKKLTQRDLAKLLTENGCKTSHATISNWELNISNPDIDTLALICKILDKDGNYFFDIENADSSVKNQQTKINTDGLEQSDLDEINRFVEFVKNKRKEKNSNNKKN